MFEKVKVVDYSKYSLSDKEGSGQKSGNHTLTYVKTLPRRISKHSVGGIMENLVVLYLFPDLAE